MSLVVGLFVLGVALIAIEVFVPGGIIGIMGILSIIAGVFVSYSEFGVNGVWISGSVALLLMIAVLLFEFLVLPKTKLGGRLFLRKAVEGTSQPPLAGDDDIGKECVTLTTLSPTGTVLLDGKKVEAASKSGFISKNETLKVVGKDNFRIIVSK